MRLGGSSEVAKEKEVEMKGPVNAAVEINGRDSSYPLGRLPFSGEAGRVPERDWQKLFAVEADASCEMGSNNR